MKRGQCSPGVAKDFECALDALGVRGLEPLRGAGIDSRELFVHRGPAAIAGFAFELCAQRGLRGGQLGKAARQRVEVEHRAARENRHSPARIDLACEAKRIVAKSTRGVSL